jgi:tungstate transport system ATP-binding protein
MTPPAVEVRGLTKRYGERLVLDIERLVVERGVLCAVVGPNGSGKTTLLSILALLEPPTSGAVLLWGDKATQGRADLRRRTVMVHERPWMFHTTVLRNVLYGLAARGVPRREARRRAEAALAEVGMAHAATWPAQRLSAGETRRIALARAMVVEPDLLLLDDPLADVDAQHAATVVNLVSCLPARGTTVLLTTHRLDQAYRLADQCVSLFDGRLRDALPDNHFAGMIVEEGGEPAMTIAPGCTLHLATDVRGPAHVTIDPRAILLSRAEPPTTARNHLAGHVAALAVEGDHVRVTVDVGVPIIALITERSRTEMGLGLGDRIVVVFKALALDVYGGKPA